MNSSIVNNMFEKYSSIVNNILKEYSKIQNKVRNICYDFIKDFLTNVANNEIVIDYSDFPEYITVTYDGGNHPEYASNVFSTINRIYMRNNELYVDTEDTTTYNLNNATTDDLASICTFIITYSDKFTNS